MTNIRSYDWSAVELADDNCPTFLRIRNISNYEELDMPHRIRVIWEYEPTIPSQLPTAQQMKLMESCESFFDVEFEISSRSVLTHVLTGDGVRQWVFYARNPNTFMEAMNSTLPHSPPFPISMELDDDENWEEYQMMASLEK